jgi:hypothetical protein
MLDGDIGFSNSGAVRVAASDQLGLSSKQRKSTIRLLILRGLLAGLSREGQE